MKPFIPKMSAYTIKSIGRPEVVRRPAKFAPEQLALGLSSGIVSDQGNLVHGCFDEVGCTKVDPYCDIQQDKFALMQAGLDAVSVDPSSASSDNQPTE